MKKILGISLVAMMAVTTANAEIASRAYVDQKAGAAESNANSYTNTKVGNISQYGSATDVAGAIANAITASEQTAGNTYVEANTTEVGGIAQGETSATHTKITYDSKGLVTNGADITLSDVTDVTASAAEVNVLDGITASTAELNILDGVTADASELNILDGATLTTTELNYVDGVTSSIQDQLDGKQSTLSATNQLDSAFIDTTNYSGSELETAVAGQITTAAYSLPVATSSVLGGVKEGTNVSIANDGTLSVASASDSTAGIVELATTSEATTGTSTSLAVTPAGLRTFAGSTVAENGTYVLTADLDNGVATYKWELITRAQAGN